MFRSMLARAPAASISLVLLTLLNCAAVVWLAFTENLAPGTRRFALLASAAYALFSLLSIAGLTKAGRIFRAATELQLTVFSIVLACAFLQRCCSEWRRRHFLPSSGRRSKVLLWQQNAPE